MGPIRRAEAETLARDGNLGWAHFDRLLNERDELRGVLESIETECEEGHAEMARDALASYGSLYEEYDANV